MRSAKIWFVILGGITLATHPLVGQVLVRSYGTVRTLGFTREYMESLIYPTDGIPLFKSVPNPYNGYHTNIYLDVGGDRDAGGMYSQIIRGWDSDDGLNWIRIECRVYDLASTATKQLEAFVRRSSTPHRRGSPSGAQVGDECWSLPTGGNVASCTFRLGRAFVSVNVGPQKRTISGDISGYVKPGILDASVDLIAETLARGMEYAIRQRPELLAQADTTQRPQLLVKGKPLPSDPPVLAFHNVTWAPLSAFKALGAEVKWEAKSNRAMVTYQGRTVEVKPFHREATAEGKTQKLDALVLLGQREPVVPLHSVAKVLGVRVTEAGKGRLSLEPAKKA